MRPIRAILEIAADWVRRAMASARSGPITDGNLLEEFLSSRAAHASQTALHGYLKTRMGTQFRRYFEDDVFADAIRAAQWEVFAACVADLTIYAVAWAPAEDDPSKKSAYAKRRHERALEEAINESADLDPAPHISAFAERLDLVNWSTEMSNPAPFAGSMAALVANAPVSLEFRESDAPILENSIRLRLSNAAEDLRRRIDPGKIAAEVRAGL